MNPRHLALLLRGGAASLLLALSALSLVGSETWGWWNSYVAEHFLPQWAIVLGSWRLLALPAILLFALSVLLGNKPALWTLAPLSLLAQLPGIVSHTRFPWLTTLGSAHGFLGQPGLGLVVSALLVTPMALLILGQASALERRAAALRGRGVDEAELRATCTANGVTLLAASALVLAGGLLPVMVARALALGWGSSTLADHIYWLIWGTVVLSILALALIFMYAYGRNQQRLARHLKSPLSSAPLADGPQADLSVDDR